jgi:endonuclease/exonuclease/phosphatase family metal-dependent hydrolase
MLRVATYNVHSCVGSDRQFNPARVAEVIRELRADIIALQEVDARHRPKGFIDQWQLLGDAAGYHCIPGISLRTGRNRFGNALLSRCLVRAVRLHDLSVARREPRGAIDAEILVQGHRLRVIATHLGLRWKERRRQAEGLLDVLSLRPATAEESPIGTLLLGDLNEWRPIRDSLASLLRAFHRSPAPRTFPSRRPLLRLDRILASGGIQLHLVRAHDTPLARLASDHLPLCAGASWIPWAARG